MSSPDDLPRLQAESYPRLVRIIVMQSFAIVLMAILLIGAVAWGMNKRPNNFAVTEKGTIIPLIPLDKPYVSESRVIGFADECIREALSHDFNNYRMTVARATECFTPAGAESYAHAMDPLLKDLQERRMVMSVSVTQSPTVVRTYKRSDVYSWGLQAVVTLNREGTRERVTPASYVVELTIERVPLEDSVRGISVSMITLRPGGAKTTS
jgi:intracellular multiplication protein IcmL